MQDITALGEFPPLVIQGQITNKRKSGDVVKTALFLSLDWEIKRGISLDSHPKLPVKKSKKRKTEASTSTLQVSVSTTKTITTSATSTSTKPNPTVIASTNRTTHQQISSTVQIPPLPRSSDNTDVGFELDYGWDDEDDGQSLDFSDISDEDLSSGEESTSLNTTLIFFRSHHTQLG